VAIGTLIVLSIPEGTGALIGVFFGFGLAFFVAAPGWALSAALQRNGVSVGFEELKIGLAILYGLMSSDWRWAAGLPSAAAIRSAAVCGSPRQCCSQRFRSWRSFH
jgi:hypothetical protein